MNTPAEQSHRSITLLYSFIITTSLLAVPLSAHADLSASDKARNHDSSSTIMPGRYYKGNGMRFTAAEAADGRNCPENEPVIRDKLTGLMWPKVGKLKSLKWNKALAYANKFEWCGYNDWRLPNINELASLVNYDEPVTPAIWLNNRGFDGIEADYYWSSSSFALNTQGTWVVHFGDGYQVAGQKSAEYAALPVRGKSGQGGTRALPRTGQTSEKPLDPAPAGADGNLKKGVSWPQPRFVKAKGPDGKPCPENEQVVRDKLTGLLWSYNEATGTRSWQQAQQYAEQFSLCGYDNWQVPEVSRLRSLVNYAQAPVAHWLNNHGFKDVSHAPYWARNEFAQDHASAWVVLFNNGVVKVGNKNEKAEVWPVHVPNN